MVEGMIERFAKFYFREKRGKRYGEVVEMISKTQKGKRRGKVIKGDIYIATQGKVGESSREQTQIKFFRCQFDCFRARFANFQVGKRGEKGEEREDAEKKAEIVEFNVVEGGREGKFG